MKLLVVVGTDDQFFGGSVDRVTGRALDALGFPRPDRLPSGNQCLLTIRVRAGPRCVSTRT
jgi:hypothetical protein